MNESWEELERRRKPVEKTPEEVNAANAFAAQVFSVFRGGNGQVVFGWLYEQTKGKSLGPDATDAQLRHLEGQRELVGRIERLIAQGREAGKR